MSDHQIGSLGELLVHIRSAADTGERDVTVEDLLEAVGRRSFAPLLLLVGLLLFSPLSGIPTFPSFMALLVSLVTVQMLVGRRYFWLPRLILDRRLDRARLLQVLGWLQSPARVTDRLLRPRLLPLVRGPAARLTALLCFLLALALPITEVVPFSSSMAGVAFLAFGLSLVAFDGALAIAAYLFVGGTATLLVALWG
jgi:hypothetical protein